MLSMTNSEPVKVNEEPRPESMLDEAKVIRFLADDIRRRLAFLRCGLLEV